MMRVFALASAAILTLGLQFAAFAVASPASAQTLTYTFDPSTNFSFDEGASAVLMGTFKVDPPGDELFTDDIFVAGPGQKAGTYVGQTSGGNVLFYSDSAANSALLLRPG
jgi:hypothetical protein